jgi:hypothetical protein
MTVFTMSKDDEEDQGLHPSTPDRRLLIWIKPFALEQVDPRRRGAR